MLVARIVDPAVVVRTEQPGVLHVGLAALGPGLVVVQLAHRRRPVAALGGAAPVDDPAGGRITWVWKRFFRPASRTCEHPFITIGRMPALQAIRRASLARRRSPVSRRATERRSAIPSCSTVITTVASQPPAWGRSSADRDSRRSQNACPIRFGPGRTRPVDASQGSWSSASRSAAARCAGEASAHRAFLRIAPCSSGTVNRPWTAPWPSGVSVRRVFSRARASSASRRLPSSSSATCGATASRTARPRRRSSIGSWIAARSTRCCSAAARMPASRSAGRSSRAWTRTRAWSRCTPPEASAAPDPAPRRGQRRGEADLPGRLGPGLPGRARPPHPRRRGTGVRTHAHLVGVGRDPQPQRRHPGLDVGQRDQGRPGAGGVETDQRALQQVDRGPRRGRPRPRAPGARPGCHRL